MEAPRPCAPPRVAPQRRIPRRSHAPAAPLWAECTTRPARVINHRPSAPLLGKCTIHPHPFAYSRRNGCQRPSRARFLPADLSCTRCIRRDPQGSQPREGVSANTAIVQSATFASSIGQISDASPSHQSANFRTQVPRHTKRNTIKKGAPKDAPCRRTHDGRNPSNGSS